MRLAAFSALALAACSPAAAKPAAFVLQSGHIDLDKGPDGNTVILDTPRGLVVVDTGRHTDHAEAIVKQARWTGKPVIAVVNTHWHLDHTTGNRDILAVFPKARLVATDAMRGALAGFLARSRSQADKALADPKLDPDERIRILRAYAAIDDVRAMVPARPVRGDERLTLGGRRFELHVAPRAATEADLWLTVPDEKLVIVGDLVVAPVPFFDTGCEEGRTAALDAIAQARWDTLIPGHGAPMTRAEFTRWRSAFQNWLDCARSTAPAAACVDGWMEAAKGFYSAGEAPSVRMMARYYVEQVLRAPSAKRMTYCTVNR